MLFYSLHIHMIFNISYLTFAFSKDSLFTQDIIQDYMLDTEI